MNKRADINQVRSQLEAATPKSRGGGTDGEPPMPTYVTHAEFQSAMKHLDGRFAEAERNIGAVLDGVKASRSALWQAVGVIVAAMVAVVALVLTAVDTGRETAAREFSAVATKLEAMNSQSAARIEAAAVESGKRIEAALQASGNARALGGAELTPTPNIIINVPPQPGAEAQQK